MKSFLALVLSALASGASCQYGYGSPDLSCPQAQFNFSVSAFSAGCTPHGMGCNFSFGVAARNGTPAGAVTCGADLPSAAQTLPPVPWTFCSDGATFWGFAPVAAPDGNASAYALLLAGADLGRVGAKLWGAEDFPVIEQKTRVYQEYSGPTDFEV